MTWCCLLAAPAQTVVGLNQYCWLLIYQQTWTNYRVLNEMPQHCLPTQWLCKHLGMIVKRNWCRYVVSYWTWWVVLVVRKISHCLHDQEGWWGCKEFQPACWEGCFNTRTKGANKDLMNWRKAPALVVIAIRRCRQWIHGCWTTSLGKK